MHPRQPPGRTILSIRVDGTDYHAAAGHVVRWARNRTPRYVCAANVHMVMEAWDDATFRNVVNGAHLVTADGMPLVWMLRRLGIDDASRVYGPTLTAHVCEAAAAAGLPVGFYGGTPSANAGIARAMLERHPGLSIAYTYSPPFRELTAEEDARIISDIVESGARILFIGLGCPRQERWMASHLQRLPVVQLGVGAAFAFHSGEVRQAPAILQNAGLEWAFRLAMEPRRLWRRYVIHNSRFIALATLQLLRASLRSAKESG